MSISEFQEVLSALRRPRFALTAEHATLPVVEEIPAAVIEGRNSTTADQRSEARSAAKARVGRYVVATIGPVIDLAVIIGVLAVLSTWTAPTVALAVSVFGLRRTGPIDRLQLHPRVGDEIPGLARAVALPLLVLAPWLTSGHSASLLRAAPVLVIALTLGRAVSHGIIGAVRRTGSVSESAIIVGAGELGQRLAEAFRSNPAFGIRPVGFVEDSPYDRLPLPLLGTTADLPRALQSSGASRVIVAFGAARDSEMVSVLRACDAASVSMYVLPRFFELGVLPRVAHIDEINGMQLIRLRRAALRRSSQIAKRVFDVVCAGSAIVVASPLLLVGALLVKMSGPGPILFRQQRIGRDGKPFSLLKFRSMTTASCSDTQWGQAAADRITPVGSLLRRTSWDEIPQLWNVLRGDMSLVGPRPERPHFVEVFGGTIRGYNDRLRVPAGLTGWSQIHGLRGDTSIADRAFFDNYYVENWSLWLDIRIMVRTVTAILSRKGAAVC